jgi:uncharacterized protein with von Willebrand factor type A (vWA) domain
LEKTLGDFVSALRKADLAVSPAESLDAMAALEIIGLRDRTLLRDSLSIVLAKTPEEKALFDICFNRFFSYQDFDRLKTIAAQYQDNLEISSSGLAAESDSDSADKKQSRRHRHNIPLVQHDSHLGHILLSADETGLALLLSKAAEEVHLENIRSLRERSVYTRRILLHMGVSELDAEIERLKKDEADKARYTAIALSSGRAYLAERVRNHVEQQYLLLVDGSGQQFLADAVSETKFTNMQPYYFEHIRESVRKLAHHLAKKHAKRRKLVNRGQLDIRKTLRRNLVYDGNLFDIRWKQVKLERPRVFVICDVSGSVKNVSRFLLTFLYSLSEVLPKVRSFAFSNELGEVTELFDKYPLEEAIDMSLDDYGKGSTDYGQAFKDFRRLALHDLDSKSTIIILGDGRNNYYDPRPDLLKEMSSRCRQIIWLNPESRDRWNVGDAEMKQFLSHCDYAEVCNSLKDLERMVGRVLKSAH